LSLLRWPCGSPAFLPPLPVIHHLGAALRLGRGLPKDPPGSINDFYSNPF